MPAVPSGWQRWLRAIASGLVGLAVVAAVAQAIFWSLASAPAVADLEAARIALAPGSQLVDPGVRDLDGIPGGATEVRGVLEPPADLAAVVDTAEGAGLPVTFLDEDEVLIDLGGTLAQLRAGQLDVVVDHRPAATGVAVVGGILGPAVPIIRSMRRSGRPRGRRARRTMAAGAAALLPLGLALGAGWVIVIASTPTLALPFEYSGLVVGVLFLLSPVWAAVGLVAAGIAALLVNGPDATV